MSNTLSLISTCNYVRRKQVRVTDRLWAVSTLWYLFGLVTWLSIIARYGLLMSLTFLFQFFVGFKKAIWVISRVVCVILTNLCHLWYRPYAYYHSSSIMVDAVINLVYNRLRLLYHYPRGMYSPHIPLLNDWKIISSNYIYGGIWFIGFNDTLSFLKPLI